MKIGIMGGTFNPIHLGHLFISEYIRMNAPLDKVIFIPSGNPPHKDKKDLVSAKHRYNMVLLATEDNPFFEVSSIEMDRDGNSYTIDTVHELNRKYPNDDFYFIIGGDSLHELTKWKKATKLLETVSFIVIGRQGIDEESNLNKIEEYKRLFNASIYYLDAPLIEVSSTNIRNNLKEGKSIKYMVDSKVEEYIKDYDLYKTEE